MPDNKNGNAQKKLFGVETVRYMFIELPMRSFGLADTKPCFGVCPLKGPLRGEVGSPCFLFVVKLDFEIAVD